MEDRFEPCAGEMLLGLSWLDPDLTDFSVYSQFKILRQKGTEPAGTGKYDHHSEQGVYNCAACDTPLYKSTTKFNSGW